MKRASAAAIPKDRLACIVLAGLAAGFEPTERGREILETVLPKQRRKAQRRFRTQNGG